MDFGYLHETVTSVCCALIDAIALALGHTQDKRTSGSTPNCRCPFCEFPWGGALITFLFLTIHSTYHPLPKLRARPSYGRPSQSATITLLHVCALVSMCTFTTVVTCSGWGRQKSKSFPLEELGTRDNQGEEVCVSIPSPLRSRLVPLLPTPSYSRA